MKKLTCEMCGSADLVKKDNIYVCVHCDTKYSVEEAKNMMSNGVESVSSNMDSSLELANLYQIARRSKDDNNAENAAKYYDMILVKDPNSWEAYFYVVYFKAMGCKIAEIRSSAVSVSNCINTVLTLIKDHVEGREAQINAVNEIAVRCALISNMLFNAAKNYYYGIDIQIRTKHNQEFVNNCCAVRDIGYIVGDCIDNIFYEYGELHSTAVTAWETGIVKHNEIMSHIVNKGENIKIILGYVNKIKKYNPMYKPPRLKTGGCYVATAVYGSYDCPEVWILRRYRDYTLAETWYGRAFIRTYYGISPTIVKWFGQKDWFKKIWKGKLDRMIVELKSKGIEDTPYEDKSW